MTADQPGRQRYLVLHDYGMGGLWWWIRAASAAQITATFAAVEVIDDPAAIRKAESWALGEFDIASAARGPLAGLYQKRQQQRRDPAFGKLLGKHRVYLRLADPDAGAWLSEHDSSGRRLRQVELRPDGTALATGPADWPLNPPVDLGDPQVAASEITQQEFEQAWEQATSTGKG